jgi:signal peptidase I
MPTNAASSSNRPSGAHTGHNPETIKDTLISIMIAFTMAFVFRGFVVEAFVIPTGSMAPTLMGAHMKVRGAETGYAWPVGAFQDDPPRSTIYTDPQPAIVLQDPIGGKATGNVARPTYSGDRILVLKYLYAVQDPTRFDVIVFKNPTNPAENYIKRLIGLPGEQIALADGDVFVRTDPQGRSTESAAPAERAALWDQPGWRIARKDPVVQRSVWQLVYDSAHAPLPDSGVVGPWRPGDPSGWTMDAREYRYGGVGRTELVFDQTRRRSSEQSPRQMSWSIDDYYPYDEPYGATRFPVSDVRLRCGFTPAGDGQTIGMLLAAREHEFRATVGAGKAEIAWREHVGAGGVFGPWKTVATQSVHALAAGKSSDVEFWHADQSVQVWLEGKLVARFEYDWSPGERVRHATGHALAELLAAQARDPSGALSEPSLYARCEARFVFEGGGFTLHRVGLDRDLHYQPVRKPQGGYPGLATSPYNALALGPDQFFACGDNSPQSLDGRLWNSVDPWVSEQFPAPEGPYQSVGVVPRDLLLGKAFFVYWPSLNREGEPTATPDFGRMRFIW